MSKQGTDTGRNPARHCPSVRRKRLKVRCRARGTLELCVLLERFINSVDDELDQGLTSDLEELLHESDDELLSWICGTAECPQRFKRVLNRIRSAAFPESPEKQNR